MECELLQLLRYTCRLNAPAHGRRDDRLVAMARDFY